jgi:hypothetical protein
VYTCKYLGKHTVDLTLLDIQYMWV